VEYRYCTPPFVLLELLTWTSSCYQSNRHLTPDYMTYTSGIYRLVLGILHYLLHCWNFNLHIVQLAYIMETVVTLQLCTFTIVNMQVHAERQIADITMPTAYCLNTWILPTDTMHTKMVQTNKREFNTVKWHTLISQIGCSWNLPNFFDSSSISITSW
jgi:hypothetical protein